MRKCTRILSTTYIVLKTHHLSLQLLSLSLSLFLSLSHLRLGALLIQRALRTCTPITDAPTT